MSQTIIQGTYVPFTCTNLNQIFNYTEGGTSLILDPLVLTTNLNYSKVYTLTMTITAPSQAANVLLNTSFINDLSFDRVGNTYTLSSEYTNSSGIRVNNWAYFKLALSNIYLSFLNSDFGESFTITNNLTDGITTQTGIIQINTISQPDVTGNIQSITVPMSVNGASLVSAGGSNVVINDPAQAAKTYRVTYTVNDVTENGYTSDFYINCSGTEQTGLKTFTISGTQSYINSMIASTGVNNGLYFYNRAPSFYGTSTISYLQEVLTTTEPGISTPYNQEAGLLTFNTTYTAPFAINNSLTYTEDGSPTFSLGSITNIAGDNWVSETCGIGGGLNCYTVTATILGAFSTSNPARLTYMDNPEITNSIIFTGTKSSVNTALSSVILLPPADYIDPLTIQITVSIGNTPTNIYTENTVLTCTSTHADFTNTGSKTFVIGSNTFNIGSITDLATSKNYSVTLDFQTAIAATLSSSGSGGTSVWNASGGIGGFGRLTITGTKTQVNQRLTFINFTTTSGAATDDSVNILYTQTQTTNNILQGSTNIFVGNTIGIKAGNGTNAGVSAFVYDQDVAMDWNLASLSGIIDTTTTYTAKLVFSTPLSTANLGSVTGWTKETDYIWTKTDIRANLNTALSAINFVPPAQLVSNFQLDIKIYDGATLVADTSALGSTVTVYIRSLVSAAWSTSGLSYNQDASTTWTNLATLNSNFGSGTYTIQLVTSTATGGSFTGWTAISSTVFEKTDTKANLQTALNSVTFIPGMTFVSNFTLNIKAIRSLLLIYDSSTVSNSKSISIGVVYAITPTTAILTYNQDNAVTWSSIASVSSNFSTSDTYTITITSSVSNTGSITGWTTTDSTTFTKTDTGANLIVALASLTFNPLITLKSNFQFTFRIIKSSTTLATSYNKTINVGIIYTINNPSSALTFDQNITQTYTNMFNVSSNFNNSNPYTFILTTSVGIFSSITGWSGSSTSFTKTGTGSSLVTALASLVATTSVNSFENGTITLSCIRNGINFISSNSISLSLDSGYVLNLTDKTFNYGETTVFNLGSTNAWFNIATTDAAYIRVFGLPTTIYGTKSEVDNQLAAYTYNPPDYLTNTVTYNNVYAGVNSVGGTLTPYPKCTPYYSLSFTPLNKPTINSTQASLNYFIGSNISLPVTLNNIPNDGTTYKILVQTNSNQIFNSTSGNINSPSGTWVYYTDGTYNGFISSTWLTKPQLESAIVDLNLFTRADSTLQIDSSPPWIRFQIYPNANVSLPWSISGNYNLYNAAKVKLSQVLFFLRRGMTTSINLGSYTWPNSIQYLDANTIYTLKIQTDWSGIAPVGWTAESNLIHSISGTPSYLNSMISSLPISVSSITGTAGFPIKIDLYQSSIFLSRQDIIFSITT